MANQLETSLAQLGKAMAADKPRTEYFSAPKAPARASVAPPESWKKSLDDHNARDLKKRKSARARRIRVGSIVRMPKDDDDPGRVGIVRDIRMKKTMGGRDRAMAEIDVGADHLYQAWADELKITR